MKTKLFTLILTFVYIAIALIPNYVLATEMSSGIVAVLDKVKVSNFTDLKEAIENKNVTKIEITENITLTETIVIDKTVNIEGNGKTITASFKKAFEIYAGKVKFNNITIVNSGKQGRCIDIRDGDVELILTGVTLKTTGSSAYNQTLNVGGNFTGPAKIKLENTKVLTNHPGYGIVTFNPVDLVINNSEITGYGALYMKGIDESKGSAGSKVTINNSTLIGINNSNEPNKDKPQNGFGTIVFEDHNIEMNINNSKLIAKGEGDAIQVIIGEHISLGESNKPNRVTISENTVITAQEAISAMKNSKATVILNKGVTSNIEIPAKNLASGMMAKKENGVYVVTEIKVDYVVSQGVETLNKETVKETLNSSLKADKEVFKKAEEAIRNGQEVSVELKVEELKQENVKKEEKQKMEQLVSKNEKIHQYFDISVFVIANKNEIGKLEKLTDKVKLSMKLPEDLILEGRKFYVLKLHDGKVQRLDAVLNGTNLEFETDEFSLYALSYEDVPGVEQEVEKDNTPKTGFVDVSKFVWIVVFVLMIGVFYEKRKTF